MSSGAGYGVAFLAASAGIPFPSNSHAGRTNATGSGSRNPEADNEVNPPWIALLFAVLCVGLERMGWHHAHKIGIVNDIDEFKSRARLLLEGSQAVLALADIGRVRAIEVIQTLVLHLHCQQTISAGGWDVQTALYLAVAARVGTMMGLSRLTAEKPGVTPKPGLLKREASTTVTMTLIRFLTVLRFSWAVGRGGTSSSATGHFRCAWVTLMLSIHIKISQNFLLISSGRI